MAKLVVVDQVFVAERNSDDLLTDQGRHIVLDKGRVGGDPETRGKPARQTDHLAEGLDELVASGLTFRRGVPPDTAYIFKHALVQEAAYESPPRSRRTEIHGTIATALSCNPETSADAAATIGRHFAEAGRIELAADWYRRAGERLAERSAIAETRAQLQRGLQLVATLPENPTRRRLGVELQLALGRTLVATKGLGDAEANAAFGRAATVSRALNDIELLTRARWGEALTRTQG